MVLVNIEVCCGQTESVLAKSKSSRLGRGVKWTASQKDQMNQIRSSLETHKSALHMCLLVNTISLLVQTAKRITQHGPPQPVSARAIEETNKTIQGMSQKLDVITQRQVDPRIVQQIHDAVLELSLDVKDLAMRGAVGLAKIGCKSINDILETVKQVEGVTEINCQVQRLEQNPSADLLPNPTSVKHEEGEEIGTCPVCSSPQHGQDQQRFQASLEYLEFSWRQRWTTQLGAELRARIQPSNPEENIVRATARSDNLTDASFADQDQIQHQQCPTP